MNVFQVLTFALVLLSGPLLNSCVDETKPRPAAESVHALENLIQALQKAEVDLTQGFLLRHATDKNKIEIKENIYNLKVAAYRLRQNPDDRGGLTQLYLAFTSHDRIKLLEDDETLLGELKQLLRLTLDSLSLRQGLDLAGIDRALFEKFFDSELDPFQVYTVKGVADIAWKQTGFKDKHYAQSGPVNQGGLESWLLSPSLDLSKTRNPTLLINQAIRGDNFASTISVRVTADVLTSDPSAANWEVLKISKLPDGSSFSFVTSEKIDLKRYEGQSIHIAFVYNAGKDIKSSITWELRSMTLMGSGELGPVLRSQR